MKIHARLLWKLLTINSLAIVIVILTIGLAIHLLAADYFMALSERYGIASADAHAMFLTAVDRYLLVASITGFLVAMLMSLWLNYRLTRPVGQIREAADKIAHGQYAQRVSVRGCSEIDQLSMAFNSMAERLQQIDKLRKDFIVDVAHELRTPLTNIRGLAEGLRDEVIAPEKAVFESVHGESLRLVHLVEELLQLARADIARSDLRPEFFDLTSLVEQILKSFQPRFDEKHLRVACDLLTPQPITADRQRIAQVLTNLFENALRYTPRTGAISVIFEHHEFEHQEAVLATVITNDVAEEVHLTDQLFERFQRGEISRSRDYGGAGLGLAIVRQLVEAHGGRTSISLLDGRARVTFELPFDHKEKLR